ncbi:MAG: hypothetical protein RIS76_2639 [Verrucomicrobiota bacterium]
MLILNSNRQVPRSRHPPDPATETGRSGTLSVSHSLPRPPIATSSERGRFHASRLQCFQERREHSVIQE